jgi:arylformamidase
VPPWIDVTMPIHPEMPVWPGQPGVDVQRIAKLEKPGGANITGLSMSTHTGTHMDAPLHFIGDDRDITAAPLSLMQGTARVCMVDGDGHLTADDLQAYEQRCGTLEPEAVIFFRTRNSDQDWNHRPFRKDYAAVAPDLARRLVERRAAMVGVDYLSVAPFDDPATTHRILLHARVWVIEGLDLSRVAEGRYHYLAAPLAIRDSDAAPMRVLLRAIREST